MLSPVEEDEDELDMPIRGEAAMIARTFAPKTVEMPEVNNLQFAPDSFQVSRKFPTVTKEGKGEQGNLTVSSGPLNKLPYTLLKSGDITVHLQEYNFGDVVVTQEMFRAAL